MFANRNRVLFVVLIFLVASVPALAQQPVPVRIFTSPDASGFVSQAMKLRQIVVNDVTAILNKQSKTKRVIVVSPTADLSLEILSRESTPTGAMTPEAKNPMDRLIITPRALTQDEIRAVLRFGDYSETIVGRNQV